MTDIDALIERLKMWSHPQGALAKHYIGDTSAATTCAQSAAALAEQRDEIARLKRDNLERHRQCSALRARVAELEAEHGKAKE